MIPKSDIDRSQAHFWSERWQEGEREADEDLQVGRYKEFDDIESLLAELEMEDE